MKCKKHKLTDTDLSVKEMLGALTEVNEKFPSCGANSSTKIDREHDIPYLAGYSKDGKTIYIDRHLPEFLPTRFSSDIHYSVDKFLILHEAIEKTLIDTLGLKYQHAHQIALRAEKAAVKSAGIRWSSYDKFMSKYIKEDASEKLTKVPQELDLTPYIDEHDDDLLKDMSEHIG